MTNEIKKAIEDALLDAIADNGYYEYDLYAKFDGGNGFEELDQKLSLASFERTTPLRKASDPDEALGRMLTDKIAEIIKPLRAEHPYGRLILGINGSIKISFGR